MLNNLKWMMAKNDPAKLEQLYLNSKPVREQIIERLFELEEYKRLLKLAQKDPGNRSLILEGLMEKASLTIQDFQDIMSFSNLSFTQKTIIPHLVRNFDEKELVRLTKKPKIDRIVRRNLLKRLGIDPDNPNAPRKVREDYLKLRMLLEEADLDQIVEESVEESMLEQQSSEMDRIKHYLSIRKDISASDEYNLIKQEMRFWADQKRFNLSFVLSLINLSRLNAQDKLKLIKEINKDELYYPENFQLITDSHEIPFENFKAFFSMTTINEWIKTFLQTHFVIDLIYLYRYYEQFQWLESYLNTIGIIQKTSLSSINVSYYLTSKFGYRLNEIIPQENIRAKLIESCLPIQQEILDNLHLDSFPISNLLKPLLLVGGEENFAFFAMLMNRRVVGDPQRTILDIEQNYLDLKRRINTQKEMEELVKNEKAEKEGLISEDKFNIISNMYFETLTSSIELHPDVRDAILKNLPDLEKYAEVATMNGKVRLCRFIGMLKLQQYEKMLLEFVEDDDYNIAVNAAIALKNLENETVGKLLQDLAQSSNYMVRKQIATSLKIMSENVDEDLILKLAQDENLEVCQEAIKTITLLPLDTAVEYLARLIPAAYYKNRPYIAEALSQLHTVKVLPLLAELLREGGSEEYFAVIRALPSINNPLCITFLKSLNTQRRPILEVESAKSLILMGDPSGWQTLEFYSDFSQNNVRDYARLCFLQLSTGENLSMLREFSFDPSPLIASLATGKLLQYSEEEGWETVERLLKTGSVETKFMLAQLLAHIPSGSVGKYLNELYKSEDYACKTIAALVFAQSGRMNFLQKIESEILNLDQYAHRRIIEALKVYPSELGLAIVRKIALLQDLDILDDLLGLLSSYSIERALQLINMLWRKADWVSKVPIARVLGKLRHARIIEFIHRNMEKITPEVKAEFAYALIMQGDEMGWNMFDELLEDTKVRNLKSPIQAIARVKSNKALKIMERQLANPNEAIQSEVIKAIGTMQLRESVPILQKYVMSSSSKTKIALAKALGDIYGDESLKMLDVISKDGDEYVRVAADIALQKVNKGIELDPVDSYTLFRSLFETTDWRLSDNWFEKTLHHFADPYERFDAIPLRDFSEKIIMNEDELEDKRNELDIQLSEILIGSTDVEKIMEAKRETQSKKDRLVSREQLIQSILKCHDSDMTRKDWDILEQALQSNDEDIIRSIIFASVKSCDPAWLGIFERILEKTDYRNHVDLIIYSIFHKHCSKCLPILIHLLEYERARYYLLFFINRFSLDSDNMNLEDIKFCKDTLLQQGNLAPDLSKAVKAVLNYMIEKKL